MLPLDGDRGSHVNAMRVILNNLLCSPDPIKIAYLSFSVRRTFPGKQGQVKDLQTRLQPILLFVRQTCHP